MPSVEQPDGTSVHVPSSKFYGDEPTVSLKEHRDDIAEIIRRHSNRWISPEMATAMAEEIAELGGVQIEDQQSLERAYRNVIDDMSMQLEEARAKIASDQHKRKMLMLERGLIGVGLSYLFGDLNRRPGITALFFTTSVITTIMLMLGAK